MLCQNCGKKEATVRYTQIINGSKSEINLCQLCAKKLGVESFNFNMPMNFADFLSDFFNSYENEMLPSFIKEASRCNSCDTHYDEFVQTGLLGCPDCYDTFSDRLDPLLRKLQGSVKHKGRGISSSKAKNINIKKEDKKEKIKPLKKEANLVEDKLVKLNNDLKDAIKEERYEDAAKIRDEIKKLEENKKGE